MKVIITRTSGYGEENPCEEATKITIPYWHTRTCTEKYFNKHYAQEEGLWRNVGKNHKSIKGNGIYGSENWITRQEDDREVWGLELNTLDELLKLVSKYGSIIVSIYGDNHGDETIFSLEIYDGYRE